ncbi:MAG: hypothetical protein SVZ03_11305 [Spirochaetota bacterium]|nr:hypothetical protein [Spirochaetota bacterium]
MRDDLKDFFSDLISLYNLKCKLFEKLYISEINKRYFAKSDNIEDLLESIEQDKEIYESINVLDCDIEALKSRICNVSGVNSQDFNQIINKKEKIFIELRAILDQLAKIIGALTTERDMLIASLEDKRVKLKGDIESLSIVKRIKI